MTVKPFTFVETPKEPAKPEKQEPIELDSELKVNGKIYKGIHQNSKGRWVDSNGAYVSKAIVALAMGTAEAKAAPAKTEPAKVEVAKAQEVQAPSQPVAIAPAVPTDTAALMQAFMAMQQAQFQQFMQVLATVKA